MLIISKEQVRNLINKLSNATGLDEVRDEVRKMLEIKSALLWKAEPQTCCGSLCQIRTCLASETQILEEVLDALDRGDISRASSLLTEYLNYIE